MREVVTWLRENEPEAADAAFKAYACFEPFGLDPSAYAHATRWVPESCEDPWSTCCSACANGTEPTTRPPDPAAPGTRRPGHEGCGVGA